MVQLKNLLKKDKIANFITNCININSVIFFNFINFVKKTNSIATYCKYFLSDNKTQLINWNFLIKLEGRQLIYGLVAKYFNKSSFLFKKKLKFLIDVRFILTYLNLQNCFDDKKS